MTEEERCYHVETLEQIKYRCEEKGYGGEVEALDVAIESIETLFNIFQEVKACNLYS